MKTTEQIQVKITEHEAEIQKILNLNREEWTDNHSDILWIYLKCRQALKWVLSEEEFIANDEYYKMVRHEIICFESTKIF